MQYTFNKFELDTCLFELRLGNEPIPIEPQTYNILAYLLKHRNRVVSKQELLEQLWPGRIVSESSLSTCIKGARKAICDNGQAQHSIATVYRRGYRFVAQVEEKTEREDSAQTAANTAESDSDSTQFAAAIDSSCLVSGDDRVSLTHKAANSCGATVNAWPQTTSMIFKVTWYKKLSRKSNPN